MFEPLVNDPGHAPLCDPTVLLWAEHTLKHRTSGSNDNVVCIQIAAVRAAGAKRAMTNRLISQQ
jgi:hypothetical protein